MSKNGVQWYEFGDFRLDLANHQLTENGVPVSLTQKSFDLLKFLIENRGRILRKEELLDELWEGNFVEEANLTQHVYMLRKALKQKESSNVFIETIPKNGYRFVGEVLQSPTEPRVESASDNGTHVIPLERNEPGFPPARHSEETVRGSSEDLPERGPRVTEPLGKRARLFAAAGAIASTLVVLTGLFYFNGYLPAIADPPQASSIAVLPFKQIDSEKDEKLGLGIADVVIARLANLESISVRPTTSIIRFANSENNDLFEIGRNLNVEYVIEGSIQRDNGTVRVTAQLYSVESKKQVWTETFDEEYTDIFALQDAISERIANRVASGFDLSEGRVSLKKYTRDAQAYQAYTTGLSYWSQHSKRGFESAIPHFKRAIDHDPHFAMAYAYLADTYAHHMYLSAMMDKEEALRLGEEMSNKALRLDSECAEAIAAKALIYATRKRGVEAFRLMQRSIELKPNDAHARHRISWMYANRGDLEKAIEEMKVAITLDPQSIFLNIYLTDFLYMARDFKGSNEYCDKVLSIEENSGEARWRKLQNAEQLGEYAKTIETLERSLERGGSETPIKLFLARLYWKAGEKEKANELLEEVVRGGKTESAEFMVAAGYAAVGDKDEAIQWLVKALETTGVELFVLRNSPVLDPLRKEPAFVDLLKRVEESEGWF